jgi:hypothetical protein
MQYVYNDGGRAAAGYSGSTGDCVTRAMAIATGLSYQWVYDKLNELAKVEKIGKRKLKTSNARTGVYRTSYERLMRQIGWTWVPTMQIGSGCKVHLTDGELPPGRLVVKLSRHLTAVIDGVIHDTYDPQREVWMNVAGPNHPSGDREPDSARGETKNENGVWRPSRRCVYGYFKAGSTVAEYYT